MKRKFLLPIVTLIGMCLTTGCDGALPGGGISTRDKLTQREITREEAKIVSQDINTKQQAEFSGSGSSSAVRLNALNPSAKRANDGSSDRSSWEYGDEYDWDDYEYGDYYDDWSYEEQEDEDEWGYKDGDDYNTWYQGRSSQKQIQIPNAATFSVYAYTNQVDLSKNKQDIMEAEMTFEYDLDNYYMHEQARYKEGAPVETASSSNTSSNANSNSDEDFVVDIWMYYKDGHFKYVTNYNGEISTLFDYQISKDAMSTYFAQLKKGVNTYFGMLATGTTYLGFVDMFKEAGFDCKYGSNDAGNLEMIIKGKDKSDLGSLMDTNEDITVSLDASFVWDQYFMRSMEIHLCGATNDEIMEMHGKLVFKDGVGSNLSYPSESSK